MNLCQNTVEFDWKHILDWFKLFISIKKNISGLQKQILVFMKTLMIYPLNMLTTLLYCTQIFHSRTKNM